jgi:hypothetical protein
MFISDVDDPNGPIDAWEGVDGVDFRFGDVGRRLASLLRGCLHRERHEHSRDSERYENCLLHAPVSF